MSAFEIGLLHRDGRITLPLDPEEWFEVAADNLEAAIRPVGWRVAVRSALLPPVHRDPADRIIVATATGAGATIVTPDLRIAQYPGVRVVW